MKRYSLYVLFILGLISCNKDEFLSKKPNESLVIPSTLNDFQAILDNDQVNNGISSGRGLTFALGDGGSDDYFLFPETYNVINDYAKRIYSWNKDTYSGSSEEEISWIKCYKSIFYTNVVLDGLKGIEKTSVNGVQYNNVEGSALFIRAFIHWHIAQLFSPAYDSTKDKELLGIPLRLSSDINEKPRRASQKETFDLLISDLIKASELLPNLPAFSTRPSKLACYSLLGKVYLYMNKFQDAYYYSNMALSIKSTLLNYASITGTSATASLIPANNTEVIYLSSQLGASESEMLISSYLRVDTNLYSLYASNDIRKRVFFRQWASGTRFFYSFRGGYTSSTAYNFSGLATDENFLIRAECLARNGEISSALLDLNNLLRNRYSANTYVDLVGLSKEDLILRILQERRKELLFRAVRWSDLKRLNMEGKYTIIPKRIINGQVITLDPGSTRYTYPLPPSVLSFNPNMPVLSRD